MWAESPPMPSCIMPMPKNSSPKPATAVPRADHRPLVSRRSSAPMKIIGRAPAPMESLKPSMETIQPVLVVPRLAPKITPRA